MKYLIGDFSKITRLPIKTLRYYHEIGLLEPSDIDPFSGYRYYDENCLNKARTIAQLKEYNFSLLEIKMVIAQSGHDIDLIAAMRTKLNEIEQMISEYDEIRRRINRFIALQMRPLPNESQIVEKVVEDMTIASIRFKGRYEQIGDKILLLYKKFGMQVIGKPFSMYYDEQPLEEGADIEVCLPVTTQPELDKESIKRLAGGRVLSITHQGAYQDLSRAYQKLIDHINQHELEIIGPVREIYHLGKGLILEGEAENYLTEIQIAQVFFCKFFQIIPLVS